jgi:hypothetical protein
VGKRWEAFFVRRPTRDEWWWLIGGAAPLGGFAIYALVMGFLGPVVFLIIAPMAVFYGIFWWASTRETGPLRLRLSLPCFSFGYISTVIVLSIQPTPIFFFLGLVSMSVATAGVAFIAVYDFPRIKVGKRTSPVLSNASRMLLVGSLLFGGGWFTLLAVGFVSSSIADAFQGNSPLSFVGKTCWTLGVILISAAVIIARRNYV